MKFYYGADQLVIEPKYNYGNPSNDYGLGLYLTNDKNAAELWASKHYDGGYLIEYEVDVKALKVLYLNTINDDDVLKWIGLLISHRFSKYERDNNKQTIDWLTSHYNVDLSEYDMVVGYRADDAYFDYSRDFVTNDLSLEILKEAMRIGKLGIQFVLISEKAFRHIKYISHTKIPHTDEYARFRRACKIEYEKLKLEDDINNLFIRDLMRNKK